MSQEVNMEHSRSDFKRYNREQVLLDIATEIIAEQGYAGFTLERLTSLSDYSKGTIYNHFSSKEDCFAALCVRGVAQLVQLFKRALTFEGKRRERGLAIHYAYRIFSQLEPVLFMAVTNSQTPAAVEKLSPHRLEAINEAGERISDVTDALFREALAAGELPNRTEAMAPAFTFASWAMSFGTNVLANNASEARAVKRMDAEIMLRHNIDIVFDGMNWQPLSHEWDYQTSWKNIGEQLFADELAILKRREQSSVNT